jgi:propanediol dehydratase small subunit
MFSVLFPYCQLDQYPGDWHILKNILPIFVKIYFDAGLKELALKFHRGATLKVLTDCTKFQITAIIRQN